MNNILSLRFIRALRAGVPVSVLHARLRRAGYADLERQPRHAYHWANR